MSQAVLEHDWRPNPHVEDQEFCARCGVVAHVPSIHNERLRVLYRLSPASRGYSWDEPPCKESAI